MPMEAGEASRALAMPLTSLSNTRQKLSACIPADHELEPRWRAEDRLHLWQCLDLMMHREAFPKGPSEIQQMANCF